MTTIPSRKDSRRGNSERIWKTKCQANWSGIFLREILYQDLVIQPRRWRKQKCCDAEEISIGNWRNFGVAMNSVIRAVSKSIQLSLSTTVISFLLLSVTCIKRLSASWGSDHADKLPRSQSSRLCDLVLPESLGITWLHGDEHIVNNERRHQSLTRIAGSSPTNWTLYAIMQSHCYVRIRWPASRRPPTGAGSANGFTRRSKSVPNRPLAERTRYVNSTVRDILTITRRAIFLQPSFSDNFISDIGYPSIMPY